MATEKRGGSQREKKIVGRQKTAGKKGGKRSDPRERGTQALNPTVSM